MLIGKTWRDAILFEADGGNEGGEGNNDAFDKERAMATIEKLRSFEKESKRLAKQLEQYEGKSVLAPEQMAQFEQYQKLGTLEDITKALQERDASKAELTMLQRQQQVRTIAEKAGFNPTVFAQLDAADALTYEEKPIVKDGKSTTTIMVSGGKATAAMPLQEYAQTHWADFLPALQPGQQRQGVQFAPQVNGQNQPFATPEQIMQRNRAQYKAL